MLGSFEEFHTQDVLQLKFHPQQPSRLFSGGEDGLIAEFNLMQSDPDEAVESSMNLVVFLFTVFMFMWNFSIGNALQF
jgi:hypothetical protein